MLNDTVTMILVLGGAGVCTIALLILRCFPEGHRARTRNSVR